MKLLLTGEVPELNDMDEGLVNGNGLNLNYNNLSTAVTATEENFITQKSSNFEDWKRK